MLSWSGFYVSDWNFGVVKRLSLAVSLLGRNLKREGPRKPGGARKHVSPEQLISNSETYFLVLPH